MAPPSQITVVLHGLPITFESTAAPLRRRFEAVYGHLPRRHSAPDGIYINWRMYPKPLAPLPPPDMPELSAGRLVSYYGGPNRVAIRMPKYGLVSVNLEQGRLSGQVTSNCLTVYGAFEDVLMISLAPLYRRRGWFPLHAFAAVSPTGHAALITGARGAGKTTTGLALLDAGWKLLSNDSPLLRLHDERVEVLAYPGRLSAFDDSLARFERLKRFRGAGDTAAEKREFGAEEAFGQVWAHTGPAGGVFFPEIVPGLDRSELTPVKSTQAVLQLLPQAIEGWDKSAVARHLHLLSRLVAQARCYRLRLAPDVQALPALIAGGMA